MIKKYNFIIIVGYSGSGKSVLRKKFNKKDNVKTYEMSDVVRSKYSDLMLNKHTPLKDNDLGEWSNDIREHFGSTVFSRHLLDMIKRDNHSQNIETIVVSGVRSPDELNHIKDSPLTSTLRVTHVHAKYTDRVKRLREGYGMSEEETSLRTVTERSTGLEDILENHVDLVFENKGTLDEFETSCEIFAMGMLMD